jgi:hypothetical protein
MSFPVYRLVERVVERAVERSEGDGEVGQQHPSYARAFQKAVPT